MLELPNSTNLNLSVFDAQGRLIEVVLHNAEIAQGVYQIPIEMKGTQEGIYYVHLQSDEGHWVQKIIALK